MRRPRRYYTVPDVPQARTLINPRRCPFSIVIPLARTNLITNPSCETNTTGYTAVGGSLVRSAQYQYHGVYSLAMTPSAGTNSDGGYYGPIALTSGVTYAYSCKIKVEAGGVGRQYTISIATTGGGESHILYLHRDRALAMGMGVLDGDKQHKPAILHQKEQSQQRGAHFCRWAANRVLR